MKQKIDSRIAVLIDAENVPYANIGGVLREVARYGTPTVKRIYGDWTKQTNFWMEKSFVGTCNYSYPTILLHHREKFFGFCDDN
ncbi:NYN domain-containing protein [Erysipelothrix sp. Poltava]|nr:NYN domain-containing protein [Erysipelothrix sp. Poltava]